MPALAGPTPFADVVGRPGAIVLDHEAEDAVPFAAPPDAVLLIGPESGLSDAERALARTHGAPLAASRRRRRAAQRDCSDRCGGDRRVRHA